MGMQRRRNIPYICLLLLLSLSAVLMVIMPMLLGWYYRGSLLHLRRVMRVGLSIGWRRGSTELRRWWRGMIMVMMVVIVMMMLLIMP